MSSNAKRLETSIRRTAIAVIPISIALSGCAPKTEPGYPSGCPPGTSSEWRCNENGSIKGWVGRGGDPVLDAVKAGDIKETELLIENGYDMNQGLINAAVYGQKGIAKMLIAKGADVNYANDIKWTPLMSAAASGQKGMVEFLIWNGADANAMNEFGGTPLSIAREGGFKDIVEFLQRYARR